MNDSGAPRINAARLAPPTTKRILPDPANQNLNAQPTKNMNRSRILRAALTAVTLLSIALPIASPPEAKAATTWNAAYGMGNSADGAYFTGNGVPLAVVASVQSNSLYYITSAFASGAPNIDQVLLKADTIAATLNFYQATQTFNIASNIAAGDTSLWLAGTNSGLATNDLLALQDQNDSYQLLILGGGATTASGLISTNAAGYNQIKFWNAISNAATATASGGAPASKLYKLTRVATFTPLAITTLTNGTGISTFLSQGQWLPLAPTPAGPFIGFRGPRGFPTATVLTYSNAAGLMVNGEYKVRR